MPKQYLNPASLAAVFRKEFELCAVKRGETIALLTESSNRRTGERGHAIAAGRNGHVPLPPKAR